MLSFADFIHINLELKMEFHSWICTFEIRITVSGARALLNYLVKDSTLINENIFNLLLFQYQKMATCSIHVHIEYWILKTKCSQESLDGASFYLSGLFGSPFAYSFHLLFFFALHFSIQNNTLFSLCRLLPLHFLFWFLYFAPHFQRLHKGFILMDLSGDPISVSWNCVFSLIFIFIFSAFISNAFYFAIWSTGPSLSIFSIVFVCKISYFNFADVSFMQQVGKISLGNRINTVLLYFFLCWPLHHSYEICIVSNN